MPRQNPTNPAGFSVPPARSHAHQPQLSRYPGESSHVGQSQHTAHNQTKYSHEQGQTTRYQPTPFPTFGLVQNTRQVSPTTRHAHRHPQAAQHKPLQSARPHSSYPNGGPPDGYFTENGRQIPVWYNPPGIKDYKQPDPGPPDGYIKENGHEIPIWYNPPGIVDKEMTPAAQAEYDRVRRNITNGRRWFTLLNLILASDHSLPPVHSVPSEYKPPVHFLPSSSFLLSLSASCT